LGYNSDLTGFDFQVTSETVRTLLMAKTIAFLPSSFFLLPSSFFYKIK